MRKLGVGIVLMAGVACSGGNEEGVKATLIAETPVEAATSTTVIQPEEPATTVTTEPEPTTVPPTTVPPTTRPRPAITFPPITTAPPQSLDYGEWAIPRYIVSCETGGTFDWYAYNPSSQASGPYQMIPLHFGGELAMNQSRAAQHAKAAELWDGGRGRMHWKECL